MARERIARNQQRHGQGKRHGDKRDTRKPPPNHFGSNNEIHTNPPKARFQLLLAASLAKRSRPKYRGDILNRRIRFYVFERRMSRWLRK
jgi:hypothetical protein